MREIKSALFKKARKIWNKLKDKTKKNKGQIRNCYLFTVELLRVDIWLNSGKSSIILHMHISVTSIWGDLKLFTKIGISALLKALWWPLDM